MSVRAAPLRLLGRACRKANPLMLLSSLSLSCGPAPHAGTDAGPPLFSLRARIEGSAPQLEAAPVLRASLAFGALDACTGSAGVTPDCLDGFAVESTGPVSAAIDADGGTAVRLDFSVLPEPAAGTRLASLVLLADGDGSAGPLDASHLAAASRPSADGTRYLVAWRETGDGEGDPLLGLGCVTPPLGLSVVRLSPAGCFIAAPDELTLPLAFLPPAAAWLCPAAVLSDSFPAQAPSPDAAVWCHGTERMSFELDPEAYCPSLAAYNLAGCEGPLCPEGAWDLRQAPPAFWPCQGSVPGGFAMVDLPGTPTADDDELFALDFLSGPEAFATERLSVRVHLPDGSSATPVLMLEDHGGDGAYSPGDRLVAVEDTEIEIFGPEAAFAAFEVELQLDGGEPSGARAAAFVWTP